MPKLPTLIS